MGKTLEKMADHPTSGKVAESPKEAGKWKHRCLPTGRGGIGGNLGKGDYAIPEKLQQGFSSVPHILRTSGEKAYKGKGRSSLTGTKNEGGGQ